MAIIPEKIKEKLKAPLGALEEDPKRIAGICSGKRVIAVGDICVLKMLDLGIVPHLAVFDFISKRAPLDEKLKAKLAARYPDPAVYQNPQGTISDRIIHDAKDLVGKGGAILIEGEEDLTALAFILGAKDGDIVAYGQPDAGLVLVAVDNKIKNKIRRLLSSA